MEIDRRKFLKLSGSVAAGILTGEFTTFTRNPINKFTEESTGRPAGNASINQHIEESCKNADIPEDCIENYEYSNDEKFGFVMAAPTVEEFLFRFAPSSLLSETEAPNNQSLGMTRRELIVGATSSLAFGVYHNFTTKGLDTKTIPASQTFSGMIYWYLQRKLGFASNTVAHLWNNFRAL